jgi:hypothetical protein
MMLQIRQECLSKSHGQPGRSQAGRTALPQRTRDMKSIVFRLAVRTVPLPA